jgi:hypothetical protein
MGMVMGIWKLTMIEEGEGKWKKRHLMITDSFVVITLVYHYMFLNRKFLKVRGRDQVEHHWVD